MLRTERTGIGQVVFALSGRIGTTEDIEQLQKLFVLETSGQQLILDLRDVTVVNRDAVQFLRRCEGSGIKLENCPLHVRRWINETKNGPGQPAEVTKVHFSSAKNSPGTDPLGSTKTRTKRTK